MQDRGSFYWGLDPGQGCKEIVVLTVLQKKIYKYPMSTLKEGSKPSLEEMHIKATLEWL